MIAIRRARSDEGERLLAIWRSAVDATHDFLTADDRAEIETFVTGLLPHAPAWVAVGTDDRPLGFLLLDEGHVDALFVDADHHGSGIGRALIAHALSLHPQLTSDVNEHNGRALGFYERLGFVATGRSETDDQGRPYPLIHLRR